MLNSTKNYCWLWWPMDIIGQLFVTLLQRRQMWLLCHGLWSHDVIVIFNKHILQTILSSCYHLETYFYALQNVAILHNNMFWKHTKLKWSMDHYSTLYYIDFSCLLSSYTFSIGQGISYAYDLSRITNPKGLKCGIH